MSFDEEEVVLSRGYVTRVAASGVYIEVPTFALGMELGPLEVPAGSFTLGDKVLVGAVEASDDLAVICKLYDDPVPAEGGGGSGAGIPTYADATTRNASTPSPTEGMFAWLEDVDQLTVYKNGAWSNYAGNFVLDSDPRLTDTRTPSNDADIVHKAGTETVTGSKNFTGPLLKDGVAVVKTDDARLSDTRTPSNDADLVHKSGTETVTGAKDFSGALTKSGQAVVTTDDTRLTNARTPTAHATTHQPGGSDAMAVDAVAGTASLRTLGTGTQQAAVGSHKYHPFVNGQYFYDTYEQGNYLRLFSEIATYSVTRFRPIYDVEYWDGAAWVAWTGGDTILKSLLDGRENTQATIDHAHRKFRFVIDGATGWPTLSLVMLQSSWTGFTYPSMVVTVEKSATRTGTYAVKDTATFNSTTTGGNWGIHLKAISTIHNGEVWHRFTIDITDWVDSGSYTTVPLRRFELLSNYGGRFLEPWSWNYDGQVTFDKALYQSQTHALPDTDSGTASLHHTIGSGANQAAAGNHTHAGLTADQAAGTASIRTLGTGATQAAAGNHSHGGASAADLTALRNDLEILVAMGGF